MVTYTFPTPEDHKRYGELLDEAVKAKPDAAQSSYEVRAAVLLENGHILHGSNHEYGIESGVHCESSLVSVARDYGNSRIAAVLFIAPNYTSPCGNCRDLLREYASEDCVILAGTQEGGMIKKVLLSELFFEAFTPLDGQLNRWALGLEHARAALDVSYTIGRAQPYSCALVAGSHVYAGWFEGDHAFHPQYSIRAACTRMKGDLLFSSLTVKPDYLVVAFSGDVSVPYLDRQHLLSFLEQLFVSQDVNLPVILAKFEGEKIVDAWTTNALEWLPHPFSAKHLGAMDVLRNQSKKMGF